MPSLPSHMPASSTTLADAFLAEHLDQFFAAGHPLAEAAAAQSAREFAKNQFEFEDGSVLTIQPHRCQVVVHDTRPNEQT